MKLFCFQQKILLIFITYDFLSIFSYSVCSKKSFFLITKNQKSFLFQQRQIVQKFLFYTQLQKLIYINKIFIYQNKKIMNQTQLVRSFINVFIVVAIGVSLVQQLINNNSLNPNAPPPTVTTQSGQQVPLQMTGPKIQGIIIRTTDKFHTPIKQLLAKNQYNIEISIYNFEGNEYYLNLLFNWGHIVLIYVLIGKYKAQTNDATKKKIMIGGALAVFAWFYFSAQLKPQRFAIQVQGNKVYDREYFNDKEIIDALSQYQLELDDLKQAQGTQATGQAQIKTSDIPKQDEWDAENQRAQQRAKVQQPQIPEDEF